MNEPRPKGCQSRVELRELREHVEDRCEFNPNRPKPAVVPERTPQELESDVLEEAGNYSKCHLE